MSPECDPHSFIEHQNRFYYEHSPVRNEAISAHTLETGLIRRDRTYYGASKGHVNPSLNLYQYRMSQFVSLKCCPLTLLIIYDISGTRIT